MKKKLLFLSLLIMFCFQGFAQAEAYPVQDINQCNSEVFDLTVQTPITLGNQSPANYSVTYHLTWQDAENNMNAIANPTAFMITTGNIEQALYIRVSNNATGEFDTTSFVIGMWGGPILQPVNDVMTCTAYTLPALAVGNYFTGPGGTGTILPAGTVVTTSQIIYIYAADEGCSSQSMFMVTVNSSNIMLMEPLMECAINGVATFELEPSMGEAYQMFPDTMNMAIYTNMADAEANATENQIYDINNYTSVLGQQSVYIRVETATCTWILQVQLIVNECSGISVSGHVAYDADNNGCTENDPGSAGILVYYTSGNYSNYTYTDADGDYIFQNVPTGAVSVFVNTYYPANVTATPSNHVLTIADVNLEDINFCLTPPPPVNDVAVYLYPTSAAQPGFPATYALVINNFGNTTANGTITLEFNDTQLDFTQSWPAMSQSGNTLTASYTNLQPYGYQVVYLEFLVAQPGIVDLGDVITFTSN
ncbi:hypothetical protein, partial [Flavobacterium sp.]